jgi:hypothetical protein
MVRSSHIARVVLGPARHEDVPRAVLGPSKKFIYKSKHGAARGTRVPGRAGTARPKSQL